MNITNTTTFMLGLGIGITVAAILCIWIIGLAARGNYKDAAKRHDELRDDMDTLHLYWEVNNRQQKRQADAMAKIARSKEDK